MSIAMGVPFFTLKNCVRDNHVAVRSSNVTLYGDMSTRMMSLIRSQVPLCEVYSVDEAFVDMRGIKDPMTVATHIRDSISKGLGLPVGIGRQISAHLRKRGIRSAYDLLAVDPRWIRKHFTVVGERLLRELQGIPCLPLKEEAEPRKAIQVSRTFGTPLHTREELKEVIATFATTLGAKLRRHRQCAAGLSLFIASSRFQEPRLYKDTSLTLESPTQDTLTLIQSLLRALEGIFEPGIAYKKAGIMAFGLVPEGVKQGTLFNSPSSHRQTNRQELNKAMDAQGYPSIPCLHHPVARSP